MPRPNILRLCILGLLVSSLASALYAASDNEFDNAKWKLQAYAWISRPTGYFNGSGGNGYFDLQRDFGFGNYATFSGNLDWRFKRKHHLLFGATPVVSSRTTTLDRTITWQGQTFNVGAKVEAHVGSLVFTPAYQYDFFRRQHGWLGLLVNVNLAYTDARLKTTGTVSGGSGSVTGSASANGSIFAPLPAIGPVFRWYPLPGSNRFYVDGGLTGMTFFGYGNFVSANGELGFPIGHHWDMRVGYLMGSRLKISESSSDIAIRLTQKGPIIGVEYHWGTR